MFAGRLIGLFIVVRAIKRSGSADGPRFTRLDGKAGRGVDYRRMKFINAKIFSVAAITVLLPSAASAQGQPARGGQGQAELAPANAKVLAQVRVPVSHANIHTGPSTGNLIQRFPTPFWEKMLPSASAVCQTPAMKVS
jgi:hypothetical protein